MSKIKLIIHFFRYRFLVFAGLLPYVLGASLAFYYTQKFFPSVFLTGFVGILFTLIGVESFNEYFDWTLGSDRAFQLEPKPIGKKTFYIGIASFFIAFLFAIYLAKVIGAGVFIFAFIGFIAAVFYLGPPIRFAYRGLGEIVIALAYGPAMVLGSFYLQTSEIAFYPLVISFVPAILLFMIAIVNEVPDFLQDRIVGKRNICVRLGTKNTVRLYGLMAVLFFSFLVLLLAAKILPTFGILSILGAPLAWRNYKKALAFHESPRDFTVVIRQTMVLYVTALTIVILACIYR